ncbi:MAG: SCP2 sterol-binding domain-containing protein [Chloroflexi bacterium]|nr:SCP2 sterol-binding domain-containing protein [Chloroflexota bacterium]MDA0246032.1 SCP2 sterol-binding domain-containing protein [Chloroflexota bacterium]
MGIQFPSDDWIKELMGKLNTSKGYQDAAKNWEGDFAFVVQKGPGVPEETFLYMDLWHGECRSAKQLANATEQDPAFTMSAPIATWKKVLSGQLDPIRGLMGRQLTLKGNMMKVMKAPKAALEMVKSASEIDTEWPE